MRTLKTLVVAAALAATTSAQTPDWFQHSPVLTPTPRAGLQGASDGNKLYIFGGNSGPGTPYYSDLLSYDGANWATEAATGAGPLGRVNYGLTWDAARAVLVLFGGQNDALGDLNDTWEWSAGGGWQQVALTGAVPGKRRWLQLDYFPGLGCVLHGGKDVGSGTVFGDNWVWDGTSWTQLANGPYRRQRGRMVYRGAPHDDLVWYGGKDQNENILNETWSFDGATWTQIPTTTMPGGTTGNFAFAMYYDAVRDLVVSFGGTQGGVEKDWTFEFDGADWTEVFPATVPGIRTGTGTAWVANAGEAWMFGGFSGTQYDETWSRGNSTTTDTLTGAPLSISLAAGGTQTLSMDVDDTLGGKSFLVLGSASGTSPGIPYGAFVVPLNFDGYLLFTLNSPGAAPLGGSAGLLDGEGKATITFTLPPASDPSLAGVQAHHAGLVLDLVAGSLVLADATNAVPLSLVP